jgi:hypothetical protein
MKLGAYNIKFDSQQSLQVLFMIAIPHCVDIDLGAAKFAVEEKYGYR